MTDPTPETAAQTEARSGRGPTRPAVKFADVCDAIDEMHPETRRELIEHLTDGDSAKTLEAEAQTLRNEAAEKAAQALEVEKLAAMLERVEALPKGRARVLAYLTPIEETPVFLNEHGH